VSLICHRTERKWIVLVTQVVWGNLSNKKLNPIKKNMESKPKNSFVQYLIDRQKTEDKEVNFSELIEEQLLNLEDKKSIKSFFDLILSNQIELGKNKRFPYDYTVKMAKNTGKDKAVCILTCIELFNLYSKEIPITTNWSDFENITGKHFTEYGICKEIKKLKLTPSEIKVLFKTINGFLMGQHPVFLNDMQLNPEELIDLSLLLSDENNKLLIHDLIRLQLDQDGVSIRTTITQKTLSLIGKQNQKLTIQTSSITKETLYEVIKGEDLEEVNLQYNAEIDATFTDFCSLSNKISKNENLSILLYGAPGTGKTEFAKQVTKSVNGILYQLNFPQIQSKFIGETEKNIRRVFNAYKENWQKSNEPIILLINEADGLMNKRVAINTSNDAFANQAQTELLEQLEKFNGILIATTNLLGNIDAAFYRRFLFKIEIHAPDVTSRTSFLKNSTIYHLLNNDQIALINSSSFTIAELKKMEQKINLIQRIRKVSAQDIDFLLINEGIANFRSSSIGFVYK
jgi:ATP-dependent 26S proteasome regulatory subunit